MNRIAQIKINDQTIKSLDDTGITDNPVKYYRIEVADDQGLGLEKEINLSMFTHDIKAALVSLNGLTRLLCKKCSKLTKKQKRFLEVIGDEVSRLDALILDFLECAKRQFEPLRLNKETIEIDQELQAVIDVYRYNTSRLGIHIEYKNETTLSPVLADSDKLRRVFVNLLDNAVKYSKMGDKIKITTSERDDEVTIKFIDQGAGISSKDLPHIFTPFMRCRTESEAEGFGLGLASVKAIIKAHEGRILVESKKGCGSVFCVVLPKSYITL
ncbi:MAG: HAMP domain-containing sensor histidine kinase [Thermodesulfobacteriota bacterium]|nr:HAMP domain-containing sensor histidine kinase [Thermodesulfobacteriota bacterium]